MPLAHLMEFEYRAVNVLTGLTDFFGICERQALSARENTVLGEIEPSTASELTFHLRRFLRMQTCFGRSSGLLGDVFRSWDA